MRQTRMIHLWLTYETFSSFGMLCGRKKTDKGRKSQQGE